VTLETGGWLVSKEIAIVIETEFIQQPANVNEPSAADDVKAGKTVKVSEPAGPVVAN